MELTQTSPASTVSPTVRAARIGLLAVLVLYAFLFSDAMGGPLHGINLAIHETGHFVFMPFGEMMGFLGGSLFQILLPLVFVGYFLKERDGFGAAVALWWVGLNFWDVSPYIADAQAQMLPLVGGGVHDWAVLLGEWGLLRKDAEIARGVHFIGTLVVAGSVWMGVSNLDSIRPTQSRGSVFGPRGGDVGS